MKIEDWLIEHIKKHPNITFGSLYRDACLTSKIKLNSREWNTSLHSAIDNCINKGLVVETKIKYDRFFNLSKQLDRDNKINDLLQ